VGKHFFSPKGDYGENYGSNLNFFVDGLASSAGRKEVVFAYI
jgi:hypothetical protein